MTMSDALNDLSSVINKVLDGGGDMDDASKASALRVDELLEMAWKKINTGDRKGARGMGFENIINFVDDNRQKIRILVLLSEANFEAGTMKICETRCHEAIAELEKTNTKDDKKLLKKLRKRLNNIVNFLTDYVEGDGGKVVANQLKKGDGGKLTSDQFNKGKEVGDQSSEIPVTQNIAMHNIGDGGKSTNDQFNKGKEVGDQSSEIQVTHNIAMHNIGFNVLLAQADVEKILEIKNIPFRLWLNREIFTCRDILMGYTYIPGKKNRVDISVLSMLDDNECYHQYEISNKLGRDLCVPIITMGTLESKSVVILERIEIFFEDWYLERHAEFIDRDWDGFIDNDFKKLMRSICTSISILLMEGLSHGNLINGIAIHDDKGKIFNMMEKGFRDDIKDILIIITNVLSKKDPKNIKNWVVEPHEAFPQKWQILVLLLKNYIYTKNAIVLLDNPLFWDVRRRKEFMEDMHDEICTLNANAGDAIKCLNTYWLTDWISNIPPGRFTDIFNYIPPHLVNISKPMYMSNADGIRYWRACRHHYNLETGKNKKKVFDITEALDSFGDFSTSAFIAIHNCIYSKTIATNRPKRDLVLAFSRLLRWPSTEWSRFMVNL